MDFGMQDGANERSVYYGNYGNRFYMPFNLPLDPTLPGHSGLLDPNFWQPLKLEEFIDQSGNVLPERGPAVPRSRMGLGDALCPWYRGSDRVPTGGP